MGSGTRERISRESRLKKAARFVLSLMRATRLPLLARRATRYLPSSTRRWLDAKEVDLRIRAGGTVGHAFPDRELVPVKHLERKYRDALLLLSEKQGRENLGDYLEFGVYAGA